MYRPVVGQLDVYMYVYPCRSWPQSREEVDYHVVNGGGSERTQSCSRESPELCTFLPIIPQSGVMMYMTLCGTTIIIMPKTPDSNEY